ncbi:MAG: UbiA prenyltransferase family protein [Candidatus Aenigmatarchaeota archaeon]|nr:MAG: UbiA prenyltransferase family protein [Candidatus Aenigmarchaeota archaeon]
MVKLKNILYNSVTVSLPKNIIQFFLGFVLYWLVFGSFDVFTLGIALAGFLLAYSAVYFFNDVIDYEEDKRDEDKRGWKLVACGILTKRGACILGCSFALAGLILSSLVNGWFLGIMLTLLFLNFLHSSPYTKLKRRVIPTTINMTAIEFLKYSIGWFAFTGDLLRFPFWIIMTFSLVYTGIYLIYKFRFRGNMIRDNKLLLGSIAFLTALSYALSVTLYPFALPLIILLAASVVLIMLSMGVGRKFRFMNWLWIEFVILPLVIIAFLLLSVPFVDQANAELTETIGEYKETVYKKLPDDVVTGLENLSKPAYESLDDVQEDVINITVNLSTLTAPGSSTNK